MKNFHLLAGLVAAATLAVSAQAQTPASGQPLHLVVPFAPGGAQDVIGRYVGNKLALRLGVPVVVDNKAGAGGIIAADYVAKAQPDGNTVLLATGGAITIAPHLNSKLAYDPRKDFASVALLADTPMTFAVRAQSPYNSIADVIKDAKAHPGKVSFASTGNGTISHLTGELFAQTVGIKLLHAPYRGAAPAITDLIGGQVAAMVTSSASIEPMAAEKKARVLGTFTAKPLSNLPGVPTMNEATGATNLEVPVWVGVLAPAKTPGAAIDRLAREIEAVCREPETQERFKSLGALVTCGGPKDLAKVIADDDARWGKVITQGGIKTE
jgi:tripartite-type tricarboxylate transporter receptor subunit TctC